MKTETEDTTETIIEIEDTGEYYIPPKKEPKTHAIYHIEDQKVIFSKRITTEEVNSLEDGVLCIKTDDIPSSKFNVYKISDGVVVADTEVEIEIQKKERYSFLEQIFIDKWLGIQAMAVDKPYMKNPEAIRTQIDSYTSLKDFAVKTLETSPTDAMALGILAKFNNSLMIASTGNIMLQRFRGILEDKIESNAENIDELLEFANNIKLTKEDLTLAKMQELQNYLSA